MVTDLIIIGAGIFGAAIAYYYKKDNPDKEVLVLERNGLCSGNTGLAAALISRARPYRSMIPLSLETYKVIPQLEKLTGEKLPVHYNGAIHLAVSPESVFQLEDMIRILYEFGIESEYINREIAEKRVSWLDASKSQICVLIPHEAFTDPYLLCMSFINSAKTLGVKFHKNTEVKGIIRHGDRVIGVRTVNDTIYSGVTVLAAGVWSVNLAYDIGINLPMAPVRSQYWITESAQAYTDTSPAVIIPEAGFYTRPIGKSLLVGIREPKSFYEDPRFLPDNIKNYTFSSNDGWDYLIDNYQRVSEFFPWFGYASIKNYIAGFSAYTPDNNLVLGTVPSVEGMLVAAGCSGAGISVSGGTGLAISRLAAGRTSPFDLTSFRADRFGKINPYSREHLSQCAAARSGKTSG